MSTTLRNFVTMRYINVLLPFTTYHLQGGSIQPGQWPSAVSERVPNISHRPKVACSHCCFERSL